MFDLVDALKVEPLGGFQVRLEFSDGTEGVRDFADLIAEGSPMVEPLCDPVFFSRACIDNGILTWPNGFDVDSIALHDERKRAGLLRRTEA